MHVVFYPTYAMVIWRYNCDGTFATSFDGTGYLVHDSAAGGSDADVGYSVVTDTDGKILVAGSSRNSDGNDYMALWRYDSNGSLDSTFNGVGYVTDHNASGGDRNDMGYAVVIDAKGSLITTGISDNAVNEDMAIWRYK